jgi:hypothetical protein
MRTLATVVIALFVAISISDSTLAQQLSVGARAGYVSSTLSWSAAQQVETSWNPNFHIGAVSRLGLHRVFALQLEVWYAEKSSGARFPEENADADIELSYLEIPLLIQVRMPLGPDSSVAPHLFAGPSVALELECGVSLIVDGELMNADCDDPDIQPDRSTTAVDLVFGAGIEIQAGPGAIQLDAMFDLGLMNLNGDPQAPDDSIKTKTWMLSLGYLIPVARW